jgi:hypothetical protein
MTEPAGQWKPFTLYSNIDGGDLNAAPLATAVPPRNLGPYMQAPPVNPLTQSSTIAALGGAAVGIGWTYDETTGKIHGVAKDGAGAYHETDDGVTKLDGTAIVY